MVKRQVFFSFHYATDVWRVAQVRNMGIVDGQDLFSDNGWEKVRLKSDNSIRAWIDKELKMRSCVVVLIGSETASRKWVQYEIEQAWKLGKGIVGIYIHKLENSQKEQSIKGHNPFEDFYVDKVINFIARRDSPIDDNEVRMSNVCVAYNPPYVSSTMVYQDIQDNIQGLIEEAITIRNKYPK